MILIKKEFIRWANAHRPVGMEPLSEDANMGAVLGAILFIIVAIIGVTILSQVNQATFAAAFANNSVTSTGGGGTLVYTNAYGWNQSFVTLVTQMSSGYNLLGVAVIVIAAAIIIGVVLMGFMRGREG